jgi:hypothetical protein
MDDKVYENAFKYIAKEYFTKSNYYKVPTKLENGSTVDCCFFSFYQPGGISAGGGGETVAAALMEDFRKEAEAVGQCLHLNHMGGGLKPTMIESRKVASVTDYGWMKLGQGEAFVFPETAYEVVRDHALATIEERHELYTKTYGIPYIPTHSTAWDSSPRTLPQDAWGEWGYPWGLGWHSNVSQFKTSLQMSKRAMARRCTPSATRWCPPLIINAWNEWSEGAYLEPDQRYGAGKLEAVGEVFPPKRKQHNGLAV